MRLEYRALHVEAKARCPIWPYENLNLMARLWHPESAKNAVAERLDAHFPEQIEAERTLHYFRWREER